MVPEVRAGAIDICAILQQELDNINVTTQDSGDERSPLSRAVQIDVQCLLQKEPNKV